MEIDLYVVNFFKLDGTNASLDRTVKTTIRQ
ncbi:protein of unknown function [Beijerinckiaceae bacterium RH AL1]|nr:protein of unknown function [Beijerinckiaceae bacterium RH CH11]VVB49560.1 protein of unknown function [Beijerinckiaceae bacterium RH AL8]VVC56923.1 protein of unknown function [Beijerinckiaceae bacterium RH AL1]